MIKLYLLGHTRSSFKVQRLHGHFNLQASHILQQKINNLLFKGHFWLSFKVKFVFVLKPKKYVYKLYIAILVKELTHTAIR